MPTNYVFQPKINFLEMAHTNFVSSIRKHHTILAQGKSFLAQRLSGEWLKWVSERGALVTV